MSQQVNPDFFERQLVVGGVAVGGWLGIAFLLHAIGQTVMNVLLPIITVPYLVLCVIFYIRYVWFEKLP
jgi:RsiW-degrading membrane proteinase PrsW (M82 family)